MRAAEAIRAAAGAAPGGVEATHLDVMDYVPYAFRKMYTEFYLKLVNKAPALWGYLYQASNDARPDSTMQQLRRGLERLNTRALMQAIEEAQPDAIVCTHFLPAEILARAIRKRGFTTPVWVQVTDFDLHRMWVHENMAGYFAGNEEVAYRMRRCGIAPERIHVTGIPIMPAFGQALDRATCAREFGLDPATTTFLLMGGGAGLGSLETVAERLLSLEGTFQLIVLAGKNAKALAALKVLEARFPGRLLAQGFTSQVERLMACADLVVTKPGGLTSSECLAMGLPMIVNSPIPGQEERNADYLLEQGVALKAVDGPTLEYRIAQLLAHPGQLAAMSARARALGRANAARDALDHVLGKPARTPSD
ncbi:galactosyldiacylglycerol synthase [Massilia atriviolacea]|uniref:Galactosyldiacylglycerol synthase n=2 Tax=Massilia atriviolacea TaxID=2495579 RepID=A0A430HMM2_9BURK|nr:galactosyldiacylglycerol synthase [Massilia atriviolacea]